MYSLDSSIKQKLDFKFRIAKAPVRRLVNVLVLTCILRSVKKSLQGRIVLRAFMIRNLSA